MDAEVKAAYSKIIAGYQRSKYNNNPEYRQYMINKAKARYAKSKQDKLSKQLVEEKNE